MFDSQRPCVPKLGRVSREAHTSHPTLTPVTVSCYRGISCLGRWVLSPTTWLFQMSWGIPRYRSSSYIACYFVRPCSWFLWQHGSRLFWFLSGLAHTLYKSAGCGWCYVEFLFLWKSCGPLQIRFCNSVNLARGQCLCWSMFLIFHDTVVFCMGCTLSHFLPSGGWVVCGYVLCDT